MSSDCALAQPAPLPPESDSPAQPAPLPPESDLPAQSASLQPRLHVPDDLCDEESCPICGSMLLQVDHFSDVPDRVVCKYCHAAIEMTDDGSCARLVKLPRMVIVFQNTDLNVWMTLSDMTQWADERISRANQEALKTSNLSEYQVQYPDNNLAQDTIHFNDQDHEKKQASQMVILPFIYDKRGEKLSDRIKRSNFGAKTKTNRPPDHASNKKQKTAMDEIRFWGVTVLVIVLAVALFYWILINNVKPLKSAAVAAHPSVTITPDTTAHPLVMQEGATSFFRTLWGLRGSSAENASAIASAPVPIGLENDAAAIVNAYHNLALVETQYISCRNTDQTLSTCTKEADDLKKAQGDLNNAIAIECPVFKQYYQVHNETWPSPGICQMN